jgi:sec-independent protein translocase protein TatA
VRLGNFGLTEVLVVILVILLLFGARRLPDLARAIGKSLGEFKKGREEANKPGDSESKDKPA